jgi:hypothetical protein
MHRARPATSVTTKTTAAMTAGTVGLPRATAVAAAFTFIAFPSVAPLPLAAATTTAAALALAAVAALATLPALIPTATGWSAGLIRGLRRA